MRAISNFRFHTWRDFWANSAPEAGSQLDRIRALERGVCLPVKFLVLLLVAYYLFYSHWFDDVSTTQEAALDVVRQFFLIYIVLNLVLSAAIFWMDRVPLKVLTHLVLANNLVDGLMTGGLALVTGGYDSALFWVFVLLIIRNTISIPIPTSQLVLNILTCAAFTFSGILDNAMVGSEADPADSGTESVILRLVLLSLVTLCCYGVQVLFEQDRRAAEEAREFSSRQQQLQATGRLAAEIAHQLKNPLSIINNAAFTLQKTVKEGKTITQQIQIIREEIERSDRIITELMGYAKLVEGRVEKLDVSEELDRAIQLVFPPAVKYETIIHRDYAPALPPLLMQQGHTTEVFVNVLQNAREAMAGKGEIRIKTEYNPDYSIIVTIQDNGPGIPSQHVDKIFEPYYTTKEKGTGLGLAIVKHNTEIYGGSVHVESELGKGTTFIIRFPARTLMKLRR